MTEPTITQDDEQLAWQILDALNPIGCCEMTIDEAKIAVRIVREAAVAELRAEVKRFAQAVIELSDNIEDRDGLSNTTEYTVDAARAALSQKETSHGD